MMSPEFIRFFNMNTMFARCTNSKLLTHEIFSIFSQKENDMKRLLCNITCIIVCLILVHGIHTQVAYAQVGLPTDGGIDGALCATYTVTFDAFESASAVTPNSSGESTNGDVGVDISGAMNTNIDVVMNLPTQLIGTDGTIMSIMFPGSGPGSGVRVETGGFFNPSMPNTFNLGSGGTCNLRLGYIVIVPTNPGQAFTGQIITVINGSINVTTTITVNTVGCTSECLGNIVANGDFTEGLTTGAMPGGKVDHWFSSYSDYASPDVSASVGCGDSGLISMWGNQTVGEAVYQTLPTSIVKGKTYSVTICYRWINDPNKIKYIRFKLRASNSVLTGRSGGTIIGSTKNTIPNNTAWISETLPYWTADANYSILTIGPENNSIASAGDSTSYGSIDKICIKPVEKTTGPPVSHTQRWFIPTSPNIQGLTVEEESNKLPLHVWFTEMDQEKLGKLTMPKTNTECNFAPLYEFQLHSLDSLVTARPFKIAYLKDGIILKAVNKANLRLWYTDTNRNTVNGIYVRNLFSNPVYSYKIDTSIGHPWDIQLQGTVKYVYIGTTNKEKIKVTSAPKVWFTVHPRTNKIFALNPNNSTATLETYTIPYGNVDAFFIDAVLPGSVEHIWIAASDNSYSYFYRMSVLGGNVLMWKLNDSLSTFNSIRTLHHSKKQQYKDQLPYQLWALGNTPDQQGTVKILQFKTSLINTSVIDTLCAVPQGFYNGPNGLFTPSSKASLTLNRMFITDGLGSKDTLSSNRATPTDTIRRMLVTINKTTNALQPIMKNIPVTSRRVKPLCEVLNWTYEASSCIVEQWKAYEPPPSFDFSNAILDIDMMGNYTLKGGSTSKNIPAMEQFNFAFHEPRPDNFGIVGRITYTAGLPINGVICDTCSIPRQRIDEYGNAVPERYQLFNAYPNPFNPTTTLKFALPSDSRIILKIYNMLGQEVHTLYDAEILDAGFHEGTFNGGNLASGVYYYRIIAQPIQTDGLIDATFTDVKKMLLVK